MIARALALATGCRHDPAPQAIIDDLAALCGTKASWLVVRHDMAEGS